MVRKKKLAELAAAYITLTQAERLACINMIEGINRAAPDTAHTERELASAIDFTRTISRARPAAS